MKEIGLQPTSTGMADGKETGQHMSHLIVKKGPYTLGYAKLKASGVQLNWPTLHGARASWTLAGGFEPRDPKPAMALSPLCFKSLSDCDTGGGPATLSSGAPLNEVQSFRKSIPIVVAFRVARDRKKLPIAVDLDLLNDVDVGHGSTSWA